MVFVGYSILESVAAFGAELRCADAFIAALGAFKALRLRLAAVRAEFAAVLRATFARPALRLRLAAV